ncbi:hypothetical protein [Musicola paradisiaca]|uniref:Uncharacterized protein n=1 Tax=Musicola paradisiaca (strain Ech703) TaxID=579405 RepID=C6C8J3_MUSP7|nr:hypothetical protein [Musicola paradisiaca]ACS86159.1 hypothetical protein Dd703_2377 [Musicola paradisiaca Ech703]
MNRLQKPLLALTLSLLSLTAVAADGYKDMKFGSSYSTIKQQADCSLSGPETVDGMSVYSCKNFVFGSKKTLAMFGFNNDKFVRLAISVTMDDLPSVVEGLKSKYGMTTPLSSADINTFMNTPNSRVVARFDKNHITLVFDNDANGQKTIFLVYTADNYSSAGTGSSSSSSVSKNDL